MEIRSLSVCVSIVASAVLAALPLAAIAGKPGGSSTATALKAYVYSPFVDEQDTNAFNGFPPESADGEMCDGMSITTQYPFRETARFQPDGGNGGTGAWNFQGSPWTPTTLDPYVTYEDGQDCASQGSCLRAQFTSSDRILTLDTNTTLNVNTGQRRMMSLDFGYPFDPNMNPWVEPDPDNPASTSPLGPRVVSAPGLFEVLGSKTSLKNMKVCTTRACMEATQNTYARFWFSDPSNPDTTWRLNWNFTRVLRVSDNTWYFIGAACDGSRSAGLSKLTGNRTKPRETNMGWYLMPLFIAVQLK